ncbi:MAG: hypothetical protein ACKVOU_10910 [Cytophagales bacterium]
MLHYWATFNFILPYKSILQSALSAVWLKCISFDMLAGKLSVAEARLGCPAYSFAQMRLG